MVYDDDEEEDDEDDDGYLLLFLTNCSCVVLDEAEVQASDCREELVNCHRRINKELRMMETCLHCVVCSDEAGFSQPDNVLRIILMVKLL